MSMRRRRRREACCISLTWPSRRRRVVAMTTRMVVVLEGGGGSDDVCCLTPTLELSLYTLYIRAKQDDGDDGAWSAREEQLGQDLIEARERIADLEV